MKPKKPSKERKLAYSDDPVCLEAVKTGKWPKDMTFNETWVAAHAISARGKRKEEGDERDLPDYNIIS